MKTADLRGSMAIMRARVAHLASLRRAAETPPTRDAIGWVRTADVLFGSGRGQAHGMSRAGAQNVGAS